MATDSTVIRRARVLQRDAVTEEQDILIVDGRIAAPGCTPAPGRRRLAR